jgi:16S rRNA (guanine527-N7)-methyltransferase
MPLNRPSEGFEASIARAAARVYEQVAPQASPSGVEPASFALEGAATRGLARYLELVVQWNARHDLTAARDLSELVDLFIADAVVLAHTTTAGKTCVDVGTGAGAPGLPLSLLRPDLQLTLVEPKVKRCAFLRTALSSLGQEPQRVERKRSAELPASAYQVAVSRATLGPSEWLAEGARVAREAVWVLLAQGEAPSLPGWQAELDVRYEWPLTGVARRALRYVPSP